MPAPKKSTKKQTAPKKTARKSTKNASSVPVVQGESPSIAMPEHLADRIARVDAIIQAGDAAASGGRIPEIRSEHSCQWGKLLAEDVALRQQILDLKRKENSLLGLIRDKVAENVIETADQATQEGVLKAPRDA